VKKILVTGAAGFIGMHFSKFLLEQDGTIVVGVDNLNDYYDPMLKIARLDYLKKSKYSKNFIFIKADIANVDAMRDIFSEFHFDDIVHLAAQAGVRHSIDNPNLYLQSNIIGFNNILEGMRQHQLASKMSSDFKCPRLVYASSSSVYGATNQSPFKENGLTDKPISLYAATKRSNELVAHTYSHLFNISCIGLRFFTVYGPWGRPDMAPHLFTKSIIENRAIKLFNSGLMDRDFTYIDDVVKAINYSLELPLTDSPFYTNYKSKTNNLVFNVGCGNPSTLSEFVDALENALNIKAIRNFAPLQPGDMVSTYADNTLFYNTTGFKPNVSLSEGIRKFIDWYTYYYKIKI
jgi:UDP-glucuronate 4-epimerase